MTLKPGWNEIGNPYPEPISWDDVTAFNPNGNFSPLNTYDGTGYKTASVLPPFTGGFVKNNGSSDVQIAIPFKGQAALGGRSGARSTDISQASWSIFLTINQDGSHNELGGFGMDPQALSVADRFDNFNPPRFLHIPEVNFVSSEAPGYTFS